MKSLKIYIKPSSSFKTKLHSDTLFGQFCWTYGYINGFDKLREITESIEDNYFVAFSDGFINDLLPRPIIKPHSFEDKELANAKDYKKTEFINTEFLVKNRENLDDSIIFTYCRESINKSELKEIATTVHVLKNSVNRLTGTTSEGQLYNSEETYFEKNMLIAIYIKYNDVIICKDEILNIIKQMGTLGFGKDASTGKGKFIIDEKGSSVIENPEELSRFDGANAFMTLSHGIQGVYNGKPDCEINYGKITTKFPKHGGFLSNGDYFKNPFIVYKPGSTFLLNDETEKKEIYGTVLNNLSRHGISHIQGTYLMPFFIKIKESA
ncbi:MAG: type III-A CRISPR-associated RAMP protein Csm4 [bacterium]